MSQQNQQNQLPRANGHDPRATDTTELITGPLVPGQHSMVPVAATGKALFTPNSPAEAWQLAEMLAQSNFIPEGYRGNPANILVAMALGSEVGLGPLQSVQNICVINGHPAVYGDALLALVMASPLCEAYEDGFDVESQCGWAKTTRTGRQPSEQIFSMEMAKKAGLTGKKGPWSQYPERMCKMRARSWLCRDVYPDVLKGLSTVRVLDSAAIQQPQQIRQQEPPPRSNSARRHEMVQAAQPDPMGEPLEEDQPSAPPVEKPKPVAPDITPEMQMAVNMIIDALGEAESPEELKDIKEDIKDLPEQVANDAQLIDLWNTRRKQLKKAN